MALVEPKKSRLRVLTTEDKNSLFFNRKRLSPREILEHYGAPSSLLSVSSKGEGSAKVGVLSRSLFFTSGIFCPAATDNCRSLCVGHTAGRMTMESTARARDKRSALYLTDQQRFMAMLDREIEGLAREAARLGKTASVRLNGCSDIPFEILHGELFAKHSDVQFFDYTKLAPRYRAFLQRTTTRGTPFPANYHLCYSLSEKENNIVEAKEFLSAGGTVAVVFWPEKPEDTWQGYPVIDGDYHDARFLDPKGVVVSLIAKGTAPGDESGFVVRRDNPAPKWLTDLLELRSAA